MIYNLLRILMYVPMRIVMLFSKKKRDFISKRLNQDFSNLKSENSYIWLHCSSVGEVNLSDSLIKRLLLERDEDILISVFTDTGHATAVKKYSDEKRIKIIYFPLDSKKAIKKVLKAINLELLILVETEIWPNLIDLVHEDNDQIILVNGRISDRSVGRYLKFKKALTKILAKIDRFYMQTELDRDRIVEIGADIEKTTVVGNLKFDIELKEYSAEEKNQLREEINVGERRVFVAGSTRTGEDEIILDVYKKLDDYILILVPRHLERIPEIEELIMKKGLTYSKYSEILDGKCDRTNVVIVDKMGVLRKFYSISDVTFVGGTLVNIGGHSLLEPLFYRKTPIFGKYLQNVKDIASEILRREIGYKVLDSDEMVSAIKEIERSGQMKTEIKEVEIDNFFMENKDVTGKIVKEICDNL